MAVNRQFVYYPGIREDIPFLKSIESSVSADFDSTLRGIITGLSNAYLVRGFAVQIPASAVPASSLVLSCADSAVLDALASESGTILLTSPTEPSQVLDPSQSTKVIGSFQAGVVNYVGLDYTRYVDPATAAQTAGWSQSQAQEVQRTVPIGLILDYRIVITTTGFGSYLPLYAVTVDTSGNVVWITKGANGLFRLGSGGAVPNPQNQFNFGGLINPQTGTVQEWVNPSPSAPNPMSVAPGSPASALNYGDWSITNLKQWMDAVMTRFCQVTGSAYWYVDSNATNNVNAFNVWVDAAGSQLTSTGQVSFNYVLQSTPRVAGAYQSPATNPIALGQSYVEGVVTGVTATVSSFSGNAVVINSLSSGSFQYGETLWDRLRFPVNPNVFSSDAFQFGSGDYYARFYKQNLNILSPVSISSWTYDAAANVLQKVTVTAPGHTLQAGQLAYVTGLTVTAGSNPPNGVVWVRDSNQGAGTFTYFSSKPITGTTGVSSASVYQTDQAGLPYQPRFPLTTWSYVGTAITLSGFTQQTTFVNPFSMSGTLAASTTITGLSATAAIQPGMRVTASSGIASDTYVEAILSSSSILLTKAATGSGSRTLNFNSVMVVTGLQSTTNAPNGRQDVTGVTDVGGVTFTAASTPTGTATVSASSAAWADWYQFPLTVTGASPDPFDVTNVLAISNGPAELYYDLSGITSSPGSATGSIVMDGVVATATVQDPVRIQTVSYSTSPSASLIVTTYDPHNLTPSSAATTTIYGTPTVTAYAQTYQNYSITVLTPYQFQLTPAPGAIPSTVPNYGTYTNSGTDEVFLYSPDNPYAGPIQWSADLVVKGVVGDRRFTVPVTALAAGTPLANMFNSGGVTGTAYLEDGQVAYVSLLRNLSVSAGASFSCASPSIVTGPSFLDVSGNMLQPGDFIKFTFEDESRWIRIGSFTGTTQANLVADDGLPPTSAQRPSAAGSMLYSKGTYGTMQVEPYFEVPSSTDTYWFAMRRDNGGSPKVYFRGLELIPGEVRQVTESQSNILTYTGAMTESAALPQYSSSDSSGPWQRSVALTVASAADSVQVAGRLVTFSSAPPLGFQSGDQFTYVSGSNVYTFTVSFPLSFLTVVVEQDVSPLSTSAAVTYYQVGHIIQDGDNLTLGERKMDRELARVDTSIGLPVYDESVYPQRINLSGSGTVQAGWYIYTGTITNPTGLAWVMNGTAPVSMTIDGQSQNMPGGQVSATAILVHFIIGDNTVFTHGTAVHQINPAALSNVVTGFTVNNPSNPPFPSPTLIGNTNSTGWQLVLPPNRRTQQYSAITGFTIWPAYSKYTANTNSNTPWLQGTDLMVIANDQVRQAGLDYGEIFGGPLGIIQVFETLPANTRIRFRNLATFSSAFINMGGSGGGGSLQAAYNNGGTITTAPAAPVIITAGDYVTGGSAVNLTGGVIVNNTDGSGNIVDYVRGSADKAMQIGFEQNRARQVWAALAAVKTQATSTGSAWQSLTCDAQTTTTSAFVMPGSAVAVPSNAVMRFQATVVGREISNAGQAAFRLEGAFYNNGGGTTQMDSTMTEIIGANGNGTGYAAALSISGNNVVVTVYGDVTQVYWAATIDFQQILSSS